MPEYLVQLTMVSEADTPQEAAEEFREWINTGRRTVTVTEEGTTHSVDVEL